MQSRYMKLRALLYIASHSSDGIVFIISIFDLWKIQRRWCGGGAHSKRTTAFFEMNSKNPANCGPPQDKDGYNNPLNARKILAIDGISSEFADTTRRSRQSWSFVRRYGWMRRELQPTSQSSAFIRTFKPMFLAHPAPQLSGHLSQGEHILSPWHQLS